MMNRFVETGLYFLVGTAVGATVAHLVTKRRARVQMEEEVQQIKAHYATKTIKNSPDYKTIEQQFVKSYENALDRLGYTGAPENFEKFLESRGFNKDMTLDDIMAKEEKDNPTIEEETEESLDARFQELLDNRRNDSDDPYVISVDEFMEESPEYDKVTLTYFDGDDTLISESEAVVPDVLRILGNDALTNFGVGSKDRNIVYVRNDRQESDYEVILDERTYVEVVLGEKPQKNGPMKMREDFE